MTQPQQPPEQRTPVTPSRRDRLRPLELLGFSVVLGVFAGLVVLVTMRDIVLALSFLGVGFIVTVLIVALVGLGAQPSDEDEEARKDLKKPESWH